MSFDAENLKYNDNGLIPAIIQDKETKEVLMMAYMNEEAVQKTVDTGETWFYSRSRDKLWHKGESSGNVQKVKEITFDCDADTLLIQVEQKEAACHKGYFSCFHNLIAPDGTVSVKGEKVFDPEEVYGKKKVSEERKPDNFAILKELYNIIEDRKLNLPEGSYTTYLFEKGQDKILKKIGEECTEVIIGTKSEDRENIIFESADLIYHLLVLWAVKEIAPEEVINELYNRKK